MQKRNWMCPLSLLAAALIVSCGGGGGGPAGSTRTAIRGNIDWAARSRAINGPSSALSATVVVRRIDPQHYDLVFTVNRPPGADAVTQRFNSSGPTETGRHELTVTFYAQPDGGGAVVGTASATVNLQPDSEGSAVVPDIATVGTVATVEVRVGQTARVGELTDLLFTAKDANGAVLALTPGSAFFAVASGTDRLKITNGRAEALLPGTATVTATVDGRVSPATVVTTTAAYVLTDLGTLTGTASAATAINNVGQVVGWYSSAEVEGPLHALLWTPSAPNSPSGAAAPLSDQFRSVAYDINDSGMVAGYDSIGNVDDIAVTWRNGTRREVPLPPESERPYGMAMGINNAGDVVGDYMGFGHRRAFKTHQGVSVDLGRLPAQFETTVRATGINDSGDVVGWSYNDQNDQSTAVLFRNGQVTVIAPMHSESRINNRGVVVGSGFLWQDGVLKPLPRELLPHGLNDAGVIVGGSGGAQLYDGQAVIDLNSYLPPSSEWVLFEARDINAAGQIVGMMRLRNNDRAAHAFLLTPLSTRAPRRRL